MVYLGIGRKTSIGNIETTDIRPPRHIGKDGVSLYLNNSSSCVPPLYVPFFSCNSRLWSHIPLTKLLGLHFLL